MGKACGRTSGSDRGNTQSIIRASGFLHHLPPAGTQQPGVPLPVLPPARPTVLRAGEKESPVGRDAGRAAGRV